MNRIQIRSQLESSWSRKVRLIPLPDKLEILRLSIEETQKYELLTTNQYLKQMELVIDILGDLSNISQQSEE